MPRGFTSASTRAPPSVRIWLHFNVAQSAGGGSTGRAAIRRQAEPSRFFSVSDWHRRRCGSCRYALFPSQRRVHASAYLTCTWIKVISPTGSILQHAICFRARGCPRWEFPGLHTCKLLKRRAGRHTRTNLGTTKCGLAGAGVGEAWGGQPGLVGEVEIGLSGCCHSLMHRGCSCSDRQGAAEAGGWACVIDG